MNRVAALNALFGLILALSLAGCEEEAQPGECELTFSLLANLRVLSVEHPLPVVDGTRFELRGDNFEEVATCVTPHVALVAANGREVVMPSPTAPTGLGTVAVLSANELVATLPENATALLGVGTFSGALEVRFVGLSDGRTFKASFPLTFELAQALTPTATGVVEGEAYLNSPVAILGDGLLDGAGEGVTEAVLEGSFERDEGGSVTVSGVTLPVALDPLDGQHSRGRGTFLWSPEIAGLSPGTFQGTVTLRNRQVGGAVTPGAGVTFNVSQRDTVLFGVEPAVISLGQLVDFRGLGFVGNPDPESTEDRGSTRFRLDGEFTPCSGGGSTGTGLNCDNPPVPVESLELYTNFISGDQVQYPVTFTVDPETHQLRAVDFNTHRGTFEGRVTPIVDFGSESHAGLAEELTIQLGPVRQICVVSFLPGFSDSLDYFGLGASAIEEELRRRVLVRMQEIYHPPDNDQNWINVEFVTEQPTNFFDGGYAYLEIGGPDPNNMGLFGYDNTVGKDVGNLRLNDRVGGRNALGEVDGYGYGGVFIESMLFWSAHPPTALGERPRGAPPADPLFDRYFDPLREYEVVAGEWPSGASAERLAEIEAALAFLSNMIADTAAHEFGHSLGLAQPFVPQEAYHNAIPQEGCLMDTGRDRPLVERARIDGNPGAHFCMENLWYLQDVLPME